MDQFSGGGSRVVHQQRLRAQFLAGAGNEARMRFYDLLANHRALSENGSVLWGELFLADMLDSPDERTALLEKTRRLAKDANMRILEQRCVQALGHIET